MLNPCPAKSKVGYCLEGPQQEEEQRTKDQAEWRFVSCEAGALDGLAEVLALHLHADAHLRDAGAHALANSIPEAGLAGGALGVGLRAGAGRQVRIVGGNDR